MPNTSSARKALRVSVRRQGENRTAKKIIRETLKNAKGEDLAKVFSILDKAAKKHIIHPNKAARLKSNLSKKSVGPVEKVSKPKTKTVKKSAPKAKTTAKKKTAAKKK